MDYDQIIADAIGDPAAAFRTALHADDPAALALVSIIVPSTGGPVAVDRFEAFVSHHGAKPLTTELVLGILEHRGVVPDELCNAAGNVTQQHKPPLPVDHRQGERVCALVGDRDEPEARRMRLLFWLWGRQRGMARQVSEALLADPDEPYSTVVRQAILVLGSEGDAAARASLREYAERHLEPVGPEAVQPERQPQAALYALNAIVEPTDDDMDLIGGLLVGAAGYNLAVGTGLQRLLSRLTVQQIAGLVGYLGEKGHLGWIAQQLLPALIGAKPGEVARSISKESWPPECLAVFAAAQWEAYDDSLYPVVAEQLHRTSDEPARASIRQRVAQRCLSTSSSAPSAMPRIGARALLRLSLAGAIDVSDPSLLAALGALDVDSLAEEVSSARWKRPERADRVGKLVAQVNPGLFPTVVSRAVRLGSETAAAVLRGGTADTLGANLDELFEIVADDESALAALCEVQPDAAEAALKWWQARHAMIAFRALASTGYAEERLNTVPDAVRSYADLTTPQRAELLDAYAPRDDRPDLLCATLEDRRNPGKHPSADDLVLALRLLGEHLAGGLKPERVLNHVSVVCTEARQKTVRDAAYAALGNAAPTPQVVDLLLRRQSEETAAARPAANAALSRIAEKLDERAGDPASPERADAAILLARVVPGRAVVQARELLAAEAATDRMKAASIIGDHGEGKDADTLENLLVEEPDIQVRAEFHRAIRRLRIGDAAAAHERIGELADVGDAHAWVALDPSALYGPWVDPLVEGLSRVAEAESKHEFGTAIDQLSEIGHALLFRAIEVAGEEIGVSKADRVKAAANDLDYGSVLSRQQLNQKWPWVSYFASLHGLRTEHIAARRTMDVPPQRIEEDLKTAYTLFRLGGRSCCELLLKAISPAANPNPGA